MTLIGIGQAPAVQSFRPRIKGGRLNGRHGVLSQRVGGFPPLQRVMGPGCWLKGECDEEDNQVDRSRRPDPASLMIGGFMAVGTPPRLINEMVRQGRKNLTTQSTTQAC
jgi:hypothetical protein